MASILFFLLAPSSFGLVIVAQRKESNEKLVDAHYHSITKTPKFLPLFAISKQKSKRQECNDERKQVYKLDGGDSSFTVLGSRSAKRRLLNATHRLAKDLAELAKQHKEIERRIAVLQKPGHISEEAELKRLKRQKLAVADISKALRTSSRRDESSKTKVVGSGGFCDVLIGHQVIPNDDGNLVELERGEPVAVKVSRSPEDASLL
eukprot:CAMPEP_0178901724 /NCGR_PEP_ID=MMETSP0786-20121207/4196_1 /TAXON_ID=186022 /ORGANISM="Thalassionema frauenfeldii, Strain CCMP 1798" /LENGTH=205 /DNA_ID=CAMNT_0020572887 /DNA_START=72 /DNA_END=685 /DNA_ORIENTATION=-